ncbi:MAG: hypothetical protein EOO20_26265 [Chryseobacterium sp.]|nr:MAG: hypothetical protein EOO20_26265 [Chryseobacterium sp.]
MRFTYIPQTYAGSIGKSEELTVDLKYNGDLLDNDLKTKIEGNIKLFCLNEVYAYHADIIQEIILKRKETNDQYIKMTQQAFAKLNLSYEDAYRLAFGNYFLEKDFHKRPLSKLTKDIAYELGILPDFV